MRKSITVAPSLDALSDAHKELSSAPWLNLEELAQVELSSEDAEHPFEDALRNTSDGWRAAKPGPQVIRLIFDQPQSIRRIKLQFREDKVSRSQEFALFATIPDQPRRDIVRQQWTFSPGHSSIENEDYSVDLAAVSAIELEIDPGRHDKQAIATLQSIAISR